MPTFNKIDAIAWLKKTLKISENEAEEIYKALQVYGSGENGSYSKIHRGDKKYQKEIEYLQKLLTSENSPAYAGKIYRGLALSDEDIKKLKKGAFWTEPGITSFSADKEIAEGFAVDFRSGKTGVVFQMKNERAVEVTQFMPEPESELLHPGGQFKISKVTKSKNAWGTPIYVVELEDNKPPVFTESIAHRKTDEKLKEMERHLSSIYSRAQKEIQETADKYFEKFRKMDEKKRKLVESGELSKEEYQKWRKGKIMYGERYSEMKEQIAKQLLEVNKTAVAYINGELPEVYALNYNALSRSLDGIGGYSFSLTDSGTVRLLSTKDKSLLPYKKIDPTKDIPWNMKKINSEVLQGILQGDSIPKISRRIQNVQEMNKVSAVRSARTIVTGAENKGRQDSYEKAEKDGILLKREWISAIDSRTRHAHALLNGQFAEVDKPFHSELGDIMFPGDPHAAPANVYNCRCTLAAKVIGFKKVK